MEWVETTGKTLDDAREAALDELGVDAEDAEFEVVEEPKQGLFGRLRSEARVRARVRPVAPPAKDDRRRQRRSGRSGSSSAKRAGDASSGEPASDEASSGAADDRPSTPEDASSGAERRATGGNGSRRRSQGRSSGPSETDAAAGDTPPENPADGERPGAARSRGGRSSGARGGGGRPEAPEDAGSGGDTGRQGAANGKGAGQRSGGQGSGRAKRRDRDEEGSDVDVALDEQAVVATEFLRGLVEEFGLTADISSSQPDDDTLELNLQGSDLGLLIGPKGATLLAIQDLTRTVVQRKTGAGNGRIHVDVGGYRQKRAEALSRFATQVADEVKRTGVRKALEPMSAPDRKVVHDALTEVDGVSTMSEGEDARRRVVISPSS